MSRNRQQVRHSGIFVQFVVFRAALQSEQRTATARLGERGSSVNRYAYAFGLLFVVIGAIYLFVSNDLQGAVLLFALGIAMTTMTLILIHAMNTDG